ncbi:MAG: hypothetical protein JRI25_21300 [Deltaproteobacteria bacterium]|nr:hypothetical protein [Deltaproteobacteria bacterium]
MGRLPTLVLVLGLGVACDDTVFESPELISDEGYEATWEGVQLFVGDHCSSCHPRVTLPALPEALEEDLLAGDEVYVVPGSPEDSLFWRVISVDDRLEGDPPPMPNGSGPLPAEETEHVYDWILDGALL